MEGRETPSGEHRCGTRKCGNSVGAIQLLYGVVTVDHGPSSVLNVMSACTPDMFSITEDAMTPGFYQPLPPTTFVVDKALSHCGKFWFVFVCVFNIHIILRIVKLHRLYYLNNAFLSLIV